MNTKISAFRSPEGEAEYLAAYDAVLKQWPVPFEELYVHTRFGETHVIVSGPQDAAPMVLLHPSGGGATAWVRNVGALSAHYRTYAVDTISESNKSILTRPISLRQRQDFADWMRDLLDGLHIERTDIVGNSFGGFLTLNTAYYLPERINKVVLISPAATFVEMWAWTWHFIPVNLVAYALGGGRLLEKPYDWIWQGFPVDECTAQLRHLCAVAGRPRHWSPTVFTDQELRQIRNPVLLLIGDHEVIYRPEAAIRRATRLVPGLKAEIVPNANHVAEYTAPDPINTKILEFLAGAAQTD
jgi:pimeloyl-ACP methyl ester carboxylesterase